MLDALWGEEAVVTRENGLAWAHFAFANAPDSAFSLPASRPLNPLASNKLPG